jgi:hypothetical protein
MSLKCGKALTALAMTCIGALLGAVGCSSSEPAVATLQQGVHENFFELDGNATSGTRDDWAKVLLQGGGDSIAHTGVIVDPPDASTFTTGGSKDIHDVSKWRHKDGNVPPKDDITNAYAAAYDVAGDLVIYFGADRYAQNGSSQMGFWFFKQHVGLNGDGTFSGAHSDGDMLVLVDFTVGGKVGEVRVYEWLSIGGGSDGNLNLVAGGKVLGATPDIFCLDDDTICATVNKENTPSPWPYQPKSGAAGTFPPGAFFEGGINVSELFGSDVCFASFLAETRASHEENSVLKDFVLGSLDTCKPCEIKVKNECQVVKANKHSDKAYTANFKATVTVENCDLPKGTLVEVIDDAATAGDPSDDATATSKLAKPLRAGESVALFGSFQTNENPPKDNVVRASVKFGSEVLSATSEPTECECLP